MLHENTHTDVYVYMYTLHCIHTHTLVHEDDTRLLLCAGHSHTFIQRYTHWLSHCDSAGLLVTIIIEKYYTLPCVCRGDEEKRQKGNEFHRCIMYVGVRERERRQRNHRDGFIPGPPG